MDTAVMARHADRRGLAGESGWLVAGHLCYVGSQCGLLVVIARQTSAASLGQFALALAILSPAAMLANMNLRGLLATDASQDFSFGDYLTLRMISSTLLLAVVLLAACVVSRHAEWLLVLTLLALGKLAESLGELTWGLQQKFRRAARVGMSLMLHGGGTLVGGALAGSLWPALPAIVAGMVWGRLVVLIGFDLLGVVQLQRLQLTASRPCWAGARRLLRLAWPLGMGGLLSSLHTCWPRYLVGAFLGSHALGVFSALAAFPNATSPLLRAVEEPIAVRLAQLWKTGQVGPFRQLLAGTMLGLLFIGITGAALAWLGGRWLVSCIYSPEYALHAWLLVPLMLVVILAFQAGMTESALIAVRRTKVQLPMHLASSVACLVSGWWLIPSFGLAGAAASLLIGKAVFLAPGYWLLVHLLDRSGGPAEASAAAAPSAASPPLEQQERKCAA